MCVIHSPFSTWRRSRDRARYLASPVTMDNPHTPSWRPAYTPPPRHRRALNFKNENRLPSGQKAYYRLRHRPPRLISVKVVNATSNGVPGAAYFYLGRYPVTTLSDHLVDQQDAV